MFRLLPSEYLSQNEIDAAMLVRRERVQRAAAAARSPGRPSAVVARAYVDQLNRSKAIQPERARSVVQTMERAEQMRSNDRNAAATVEQLNTLASQLEADANGAAGADKKRLSALAETLKERATRLK